MIQGNTLQSTGYQHLSANNTVRGASTHSRSIHFTESLRVYYINNFQTYLLYTHTHTHQSQRMAQVHNTNHTFACTQLSRSLAEVQT